MNTTSRRRCPKSALLVLMVIIVLGAVLRLHGLTQESLWTDEIYTWKRTQYDSFGDVFRIGLRGDVHPPFLYAFYFFIVKYCGDSETVLRLPAALCGILAIPAMFLLGARLYSYQEGLSAGTWMDTQLLSICFATISLCCFTNPFSTRMYGCLKCRINRGIMYKKSAGWPPPRGRPGAPVEEVLNIKCLS